jgi:spore germination protein KC
LVVCGTPLKELFQITPTNNISVSFDIRDLLAQLKKNGVTYNTDIGSALSAIAVHKIGYTLNYIGVVNKNIKFLGIAVMKDSRLVGIIPADKAVYVTNIVGKKASSNLEIPDPNNKDNVITVSTNLHKRKVDVSYEKGRVVININLKFTARVQYQDLFGKLEENDKEKVEDAISQIHKKQTLKIIRRAQTNFKCDFFKFYLTFRSKYPNIAKNIDWDQKFSEAQVNVNVKTDVKSFGLFNVE